MGRDGLGAGILLTHGFMATAHMWLPNLAALAAEHTVVRWDIRGHGASGSPLDPAEYSPEATVEDMAARILDAAGLESAVIVGMSMGGYLSLLFQLHHPERTSGIVLVDCGPGFKKDEARDAWNGVHALGRAEDFERGGLRHRTVHEPRSVMPRIAMRAGWRWPHCGIRPQKDSSVISNLPNIDVPTLVFVGEHDERFLPGSRYMTAKIPDAELYVVSGAGHAGEHGPGRAVQRSRCGVPAGERTLIPVGARQRAGQPGSVADEPTRRRSRESSVVASG